MKAYSSDLRGFLETVPDQSLPMDLFEGRAAHYLNMTRRVAQPKTTGRRLTTFRKFATWAGYPDALDEYVAPVPAKGQPHPIPELLEGLIRMEEVANNHEQRAIIGLCGYAGLRISEALDAQVGWFDTGNMRLTVRGKGDKTRVVPLSERCWQAVTPAYIDALMGDGNLISYQDRSARKVVTTLGRRAGLSRAVSSHDLRATFATITYDATLDQRVVQELLGHASGTTTEVYIGRSTDQMKKAVDW